MRHAHPKYLLSLVQLSHLNHDRAAQVEKWQDVEIFCNDRITKWKHRHSQEESVNTMRMKWKENKTHGALIRATMYWLASSWYE